MIIYYNADCSKCREAIDLLNGASCEFEVREYLKKPPTEQELQVLLQKLRCKPFDLVRKSEPLYLEQFSGKAWTDTEWLHILSTHPVLIERPVVIDGDRAIIGRPPVKVIEFIKQ